MTTPFRAVMFAVLLAVSFQAGQGIMAQVWHHGGKEVVMTWADPEKRW